jgi:hypothetical protein
MPVKEIDREKKSIGQWSRKRRSFRIGDPGEKRLVGKE